MQCNSVPQQGALVLNARHVEQEHGIIEIKCHLGNQPEKDSKLVQEPFMCHSVLFLILNS